MRIAWNHFMLRSLRFRLTFWNTIVFLGLLAVAMVGLRLGLWVTLLRELDGQLQEDLVEVRLMLGELANHPQQLQEEFNRKAISHDKHGWFVHVYDTQGEQLYASIGSPSESDFSGVYRIVKYRVQSDQEIVVGALLAPIKDDLARLTELMLFVGLSLAVVIPLTGYWLAGRATRPLAFMAATAARLQPEELGERLPRTGTEDELDNLAGLINGFLDRLADYLHRKQDFLANAAHELRSPLTALRNSIDVALHRDRSSSEYVELLATLAEECSSLSSLVNQLLLLAEGDSGRLQPGENWQQLDILVARSVEMFRGVAEIRGVELVEPNSIPVRLRCESAHLRQVLHNLIDNALKFTPRGGRVSVHLTVEAGNAVIIVADDGEGIPAQHLPHIVERFYRIDKSRQRGPNGGTGLGLSICDVIVRAYHGKMNIESISGKGTQVTLTLPIENSKPITAKFE